MNLKSVFYCGLFLCFAYCSLIVGADKDKLAQVETGSGSGSGSGSGGGAGSGSGSGGGAGSGGGSGSGAIVCTIPADCDDEDPCTADTCNTASMMCKNDDIDADADGHLAQVVAGVSCRGDDCSETKDDDNDDGLPDGPQIYPGNDEVCDGLDNDCNCGADKTSVAVGGGCSVTCLGFSCTTPLEVSLSGTNPLSIKGNYAHFQNVLGGAGTDICDMTGIRNEAVYEVSVPSGDAVSVCFYDAPSSTAYVTSRIAVSQATCSEGDFTCLGDSDEVALAASTTTRKLFMVVQSSSASTANNMRDFNVYAKVLAIGESCPP